MPDPYFFHFLKYLVKLKPAYSGLRPFEHELPARLARGKNCVIEVGVFEGVTSRILCQSIDPNGTIYLVDPFPKETLMERLLGISFAEFITRRNISKWKNQAKIIRLTSVEASKALAGCLDEKANLIFIDALHGYEDVLEDFNQWSGFLAPNGVIAFDDTDVDDFGPGLLVSEINQGKHGNWKTTTRLGRITVVERTTGSVPQLDQPPQPM